MLMELECDWHWFVLKCERNLEIVEAAGFKIPDAFRGNSPSKFPEWRKLWNGKMQFQKREHKQKLEQGQLEHWRIQFQYKSFRFLIRMELLIGAIHLHRLRFFFFFLFFFFPRKSDWMDVVNQFKCVRWLFSASIRVMKPIECGHLRIWIHWMIFWRRICIFILIRLCSMKWIEWALAEIRRVEIPCGAAISGRPQSNSNAAGFNGGGCGWLPQVADSSSRPLIVIIIDSINQVSGRWAGEPALPDTRNVRWRLR